jgi:hypothetical protein
VNSAYVLHIYLSPADPTVVGEYREGRASYAGNAVVFTPTAGWNTLQDGLSNTILYAEHYGHNCGGTDYYWSISDFPVHLNPPILDGIKTIRRTTFADAQMGDVLPVSGGSPGQTRASVRGLTFQVRPRPKDCDPRIPQTPHSTGMVVALADGSVRTLGERMSEATFWGAVTPAGGEVLNNDW